MMTVIPLDARPNILKKHINQYIFLGLGIAFTSILIACAIVSYQMTGKISLSGFKLAQTTNPAIWALDLTPFIFAYWGHSFCHGLFDKVEEIIADKHRKFRTLSDELALQLKFENNYDKLTNLPNHRFFCEKIQQSLDKIGNEENLAVILLNIKGFKEINDNFGSFNANNVLIQFAECLRNVLVEPYMLEGIVGMNVAARLQNDEFSLLISRIRKDSDLEKLLAQIVQSTSTHFMIDGNKLAIFSIAGLVLYPIHGHNAEILLHNANVAIAHSKKEGKAHAIYHPDMEDHSAVATNFMKELKNAIDNEELEIYYQPNIELATGKIVGAEALIRFDNSKLGILNADKFIHLVEGTSLIRNLTSFVLKGVVNQLNLWHQAGHELYVSVNLSATDAADIEIVDHIQNLLQTHDISSEYLRIDLTERACLSNQAKTIQVTNQLAALGIKISIEDFCSGYTSFAYLTNFSISEIKIEKSFVMNMLKDEKKMIMVKAIMDLAHSLNLDVLAIGVEDKQILEKLIQLNCLYGQGYYFSPAIKVDDFNLLLSNPLIIHSEVKKPRNISNS